MTMRYLSFTKIGMIPITLDNLLYKLQYTVVNYTLLFPTSNTKR